MFKLLQNDGEARLGMLSTSHGEIETPVFMPVGTRGSVKMLDQEELSQLGFRLILGNTYHLYLRPGHELIENIGGDLHNFISWDHALLTDSGGYQVFSLADKNKITDEGVEFQSHIDGSKHFISPQKSMEIQKALGSDIVMVFDECPALPNSPEVIQKAVERTLKWAKICADYPLKPHQKLFGIIQGGLDLELRKQCLSSLEELNFPGLAVGGLSVGEKNEQMKKLCQDFVPLMPGHKPRYLMGVGTPLDLLDGVKAGLDMFDCVLPTRNARNGQFFTLDGPRSLKQLRYREDSRKLDEDCSCKICLKYSRAYLRHLYNVKEPLAHRALTFHNLFFYQRLMSEMRQHIKERRFDDFYTSFYKRFSSDRKD